jgi:hypothetical protein
MAGVKIPNAGAAVRPIEKLTNYLLSLAHPAGAAKAVFFRALGYDDDNATALAEALLGIAVTQDVHATIESGYGTKYVVLGDLNTPSGRTARILTVWIVNRAETTPRFVTAYPAASQEDDND